MRACATVRGRLAIALAVTVLMPLVAAGSVSATPLTVSISGANGVVRSTEPGRTCAEDGRGSYRHFGAEATLAPGALGNLAGVARTTLDVHYDGPAALGRGGPNAFLLGAESHITLTNQRGSVQIAMRNGNCDTAAVSFDGDIATSPTPGAWVGADVAGTGAYRGVTGSGTYTFMSELHPGADNAWSIRLNGDISVLQPALAAKVEKTYWGNLGLDYLSRVVTVVYRIGNTGPGDSFAARLTKAASPNGGVKPCNEPPGTANACPNGGAPAQALGDLLSCGDATLPATCDTELITVRYQLNSLGGPCTLVILGCNFSTTLDVAMPDALDVSTTKTVTVPVRAPTLPPPL